APDNAICRRRSGESFAARAFAAADAICLRCSRESFVARAFAAADAICLRCSRERFVARALPPMLCISEILSGFFIPQSYHNGLFPFLLNSSSRTHMNLERNELAPISSYTDSGILREPDRPTRVSKAVFRRSDSSQANVAAAESSSFGVSDDGPAL